MSEAEDVVLGGMTRAEVERRLIAGDLNEEILVAFKAHLLHPPCEDAIQPLLGKRCDLAIDGLRAQSSTRVSDFEAWFNEWIGEECGVETFDSLRRQRMRYKDLVHAGWDAARLSAIKPTVNPLQEHYDNLAAEVSRLQGLINSPEIDLFLRAVHLEAVHQDERWGTSHDRAKRPADWFWLIGYLGGKALHSQLSDNTEKALHHCISTAAALYNWHCAIKGVDVRMCPGSSDVERIVEAAFPGSSVTTDGDGTIYCHACSEAGGAGMPVEHAPPACATRTDSSCKPSAIRTAPDGWRECKACGASADADTIMTCRRTGKLPG